MAVLVRIGQWQACTTRPSVVGASMMSEDVPSPCTGICRIAPGTGLCLGCARALDEIAAWPGLDAAGKRAILAKLPARKA